MLLTSILQTAIDSKSIEKIADNDIIHSLLKWSIDLGGRIIGALLIFLIGRFIISLLNKMVAKLLDRRKVDESAKGFIKSLVNIILMVLLVIAIVSKLGIETTSIAALLASAGVAVGMALSGNLQNFAGGLIVLFLKPYKVGDFIENGSVAGTVKEIQIFHTILVTPDNKLIFIPNGTLSSGMITNYSKESTRRLEWIIGVEYDEDYERVKATLERLLKEETRLLDTPEPMIVLKELADSSVNIMVRAWVKSSDYWNVYFDMNKNIYATFNKEGIGFPFPQLTIHKAEN